MTRLTESYHQVRIQLEKYGETGFMVWSLTTPQAEPGVVAAAAEEFVYAMCACMAWYLLKDMSDAL